MAVVVLAEKPSVARDLAQVLGARKKGNGYIEGNQYIVTWAIGHLVTLPQPHEIDPSWKSWRSDTLPMLPSLWPLQENPSTKEQFQIVKNLLTHPDTEKVICATDAGREGELIFRYIYEKAHATAPVERLWISSLTSESIRDGFRKLKPMSSFDSLSDAAKARSRADWLVGMNLSRGYSIRYGEHFSVGRVQTPTLSILAERELEIREFKPEDFWEVLGKFSKDGEESFEAQLWDGDQKRPQRFAEEKASLDTIHDLKEQSFSVKSLDERKIPVPPPLLYDLTELQRHCNRLYGFQAQRTLEIAQSLYEAKKAISYPRTDSRHLSQDMAKQLPKLCQALAGRYEGKIHDRTGSTLSKRFVDDSQVTDHHAIIPTGVEPRGLTQDQEKVFDLICRRFFMAWHDNYEYSSSKVLVQSEHGQTFQARGKRLIQLGWKVLEAHPQKEKDKLLPSYLAEGLALNSLSFKNPKKQTQSPARLTEASLLTAMESAGRKLEDKELSLAMKERGLGTPATRSATIETLVKRNYVERRGKLFHVSDKGLKLISLVHPEVKSPKMTGEWEFALNQIQKQENSLGQFATKIEDYLKEVLSKVLEGAPKQAAYAAPVQVSGVEIGDELIRDKTSARDLKELLKESFGFDRFRDYQHEVCKDITRGKDALLVMPTGAGKSLCYQLPGIALGGSTVVISPLIALMDDQVSKLVKMGFRAEAIHSGKSRQESRAICKDYLEGRIDFLYIAPERLGVPGFVNLLGSRKPTLIAIDEAHCISQWGHDFRPDYRMLRERLEPLRPSVIVAMTATATPRVQQDISDQLGLQKPAMHSHGFRRTNIAIESVEVSKSQRIHVLQKLLAKERHRPAIVYAPTRKQAEECASYLGDEAEVYHAGMPADARARVQQEFLENKVEIMVATVAFGMGIDKPDVRMVAHLAFPGSLEGYYQEIGRAGRDGKLSRAVMFYSYADFKTHEFFHKKNYPEIIDLKGFLKQIPESGIPRQDIRISKDADLDNYLEKLWVHGAVRFDGEDKVYRCEKKWELPYEAQRQHRLSQLKEVSSYAQNQSRCRMLQLMGHFGDPDAKGATCEICHVCSPDNTNVKTLRPLNAMEKRYLARIMDNLQGDSYLAVGTLYRKAFEGLGVSRQQPEELID